MRPRPLVIARSANGKLTDPAGRTLGCSSTAVPLATCPTSCPLLAGGCYTLRGVLGPFHTAPLADHYRNHTREDLADTEARQIDALPAVRPLRVHVIGDCATPHAARTVGAAMARFDARATRPNARAWTYTHAWRDIPREDWRGARVLASCHSRADIIDAHACGYAPAVIVASISHRAQDAERYGLPGWTLIPCPADQHTPDGRRHSTCDRCRICRNPDRLHATRSIVTFKAK